MCDLLFFSFFKYLRTYDKGTVSFYLSSPPLLLHCIKICNPLLLFSFIFQVQRTHTKIHNPVELMMALCTVRCLVNTTTSMLTKLRLSPTWAAQKCKNLSVSPRLLSGIVKVKTIFIFLKLTFVSFDIFLFTSLYFLT